MRECGFPEYSEATGRTRIKQLYKRPQALPKPFYPPKWRLKTNMNSEVSIG